MFFFLSKTLTYLIRPLSIVVALFLSSWVLKNPLWKRRLFIAGISLLLLFSNDFIANELMKAWELPVTPLLEIKKEYEYGILLCGVAKSDVGPNDRIYLAGGADRVTHSLMLYRMGYIRKILISGGSGLLSGQGEKEADQLASLLELMGVPGEDLVIENSSRNTHESSVEVAKMLNGISTPEQCLLITSASHMRRSLGCFAKTGWKMDYFSVDFQSHNRRFTPDVLIVPKIEALNSWSVLMKEWVGYIVYSIVGYI